MYTFITTNTTYFHAKNSIPNNITRYMRLKANSAALHIAASEPQAASNIRENSQDNAAMMAGKIYNSMSLNGFLLELTSKYVVFNVFNSVVVLVLYVAMADTDPIVAVSSNRSIASWMSLSWITYRGGVRVR